MRSLIRMTREVYHCYMDTDDKLYDRPIGSIGKRNLGKNRDDFLKNYITLIMSVNVNIKMLKSSNMKMHKYLIVNFN